MQSAPPAPVYEVKLVTTLVGHLIRHALPLAHLRDFLERFRLSFLNSDAALATLAVMSRDQLRPVPTSDVEECARLRAYLGQAFPEFELGRTTTGTSRNLLYGFVSESEHGEQPRIVLDYSLALAYELEALEPRGPLLRLILAHTVFHEFAHATRQFFFGPKRSPPSRSTRAHNTDSHLDSASQDRSPSDEAGGFVLDLVFFGYVLYAVWEKDTPLDGSSMMRMVLGRDLRTSIYHVISASTAQTLVDEALAGPRVAPYVRDLSSLPVYDPTSAANANYASAVRLLADRPGLSLSDATPIIDDSDGSPSQKTLELGQPMLVTCRYRADAAW